MRSQEQILNKIRELKRQRKEYEDLVTAGKRRKLNHAVQKSREKKLYHITVEIEALSWVIDGTN